MGPRRPDAAVREAGDLPKMILIACPQSRNGTTRRRWPKWLDRLAEAGIDARLVETEHPGHATEIAAASGETVVAVGGDGTINEVLCGVLQGGGNVKMGVLYAGTSPDFCTFPRHSHGPEACDRRLDLRQVKTGRRPPADISQRRGQAGRRVLRLQLQHRFRRPGGPVCEPLPENSSATRAGRCSGVLKAIALSSPADVSVEIDGRTHELPRCNHLVLVKNPLHRLGVTARTAGEERRRQGVCTRRGRAGTPWAVPAPPRFLYRQDRPAEGCLSRTVFAHPSPCNETGGDRIRRRPARLSAGGRRS